MRDRIEWPRRAVGVVVCLVAGLVPAEASAQNGLAEGMTPPGREQAGAAPQEEEETKPFVNRGLMLAPGQAFTSLDLRASTAPIRGSTMDMSIGAGLGLMKGLAIDGSLGTLSLAPAMRYHSPKIGLWYEIVDTEPLEIDATTHVTFGVAGQPTLMAVEPGAAAVVRLADAVRVDAAAFLPVAMGEGMRIGLRMPVSLAVQLGPYFHASVSSGLERKSVLDPQVCTRVPLGFSVGATAPLGNGGYAAVTPSLSWPSVTEIGGRSSAGMRPMVVGATISIVTPP